MSEKKKDFEDAISLVDSGGESLLGRRSRSPVRRVERRILQRTEERSYREDNHYNGRRQERSYWRDPRRGRRTPSPRSLDRRLGPSSNYHLRQHPQTRKEVRRYIEPRTETERKRSRITMPSRRVRTSSGSLGPKKSMKHDMSKEGLKEKKEEGKKTQDQEKEKISEEIQSKINGKSEDRAESNQKIVKKSKDLKKVTISEEVRSEINENVGCENKNTDRAETNPERKKTIEEKIDQHRELIQESIRKRNTKLLARRKRLKKLQERMKEKNDTKIDLKKWRSYIMWMSKGKKECQEELDKIIKVMHMKDELISEIEAEITLSSNDLEYTLAEDDHLCKVLEEVFDCTRHVFHENKNLSKTTGELRKENAEWATQKLNDDEKENSLKRKLGKADRKKEILRKKLETKKQRIKELTTKNDELKKENIDQDKKISTLLNNLDKFERANGTQEEEIIKLAQQKKELESEIEEDKNVGKLEKEVANAESKKIQTLENNTHLVFKLEIKGVFVNVFKKDCSKEKPNIKFLFNEGTNQNSSKEGQQFTLKKGEKPAENGEKFLPQQSYQQPMEIDFDASKEIVGDKPMESGEQFLPQQSYQQPMEKINFDASKGMVEDRPMESGEQPQHYCPLDLSPISGLSFP